MIENKTGPTEMLSNKPNVIPLSRASSMIIMYDVRCTKYAGLYLEETIDETIILSKVSTSL